jgi:hypothetical protein
MVVLNVLAPVSLDDPTATVYFKREIVDQPYAKMRSHHMAFMDALAISLAEQRSFLSIQLHPRLEDWLDSHRFPS